MTPIATHYLPAAEIAIEIADSDRKTLTDQTQREVDRLTESIFFDKTGLCRRSIVMADIGGGGVSSLWLAVSVASALGKALGFAVRVLSVGSRLPRHQLGPASTEMNGAAGHCILERVEESLLTSDNPTELPARLASLRAVGSVVIVHMVCPEEQFDIPVRTSPIDGVVLLVRASQTRRASLASIEKRLDRNRQALIGSVLLDRMQPIPEKLYKLL